MSEETGRGDRGVGSEGETQVSALRAALHHFFSSSQIRELLVHVAVVYGPDALRIMLAGRPFGGRPGPDSYLVAHSRKLGCLVVLRQPKLIDMVLNLVV